MAGHQVPVAIYHLHQHRGQHKIKTGSAILVAWLQKENGRVTSWSNEMSILLFLDYSEFRRDSGPDVMFLKLKKFIDFQENISHVPFCPIFRDNLYDQMSQSAPLWL